jgi:hypothetical protein
MHGVGWGDRHACRMTEGHEAVALPQGGRWFIR